MNVYKEAVTRRGPGANSALPCSQSALQLRYVEAELAGHTLQESTEAGCKFNIVQPGSSVATALSEGESKKKHIVLLEVNGEQFRTINYPLESVRPFIHDNVRHASLLYIAQKGPLKWYTSWPPMVNNENKRKLCASVGAVD